LRTRIINLLGIAGAVMALVGFVFSHFNPSGVFVRYLALGEAGIVNYLTSEGTVLIILGLVYLLAYINLHEPGNMHAYWAALGIGAVGLLSFVVALVRSLWPIIFSGDSYIVPNGMLLMGLSLIYVFVSMAICSDATWVVLTKRELSAYFYSPVAYLLILGMTLVGWFMYFRFVN